MNRFVCLFVCLFVFNSTSYAARIQVDVSGILNSANGNDGSGNSLPSDIIKPGDAFAYRLVFNETNTPDDFGGYLNAITSFSGQAGGFSFAGQSGRTEIGQSSSGNNVFNTIHGTNIFSNNPGNRNDFDQISASISGLQLNYINFVSYTGVDTGNNNNALTQDKLPSAIPPGTGQLFFLFSGPGSDALFIASGALQTITVTNLDNVSPVPVPAAVWLFGSGLLSLLGFSQRSAVTKKAKL